MLRYVCALCLCCGFLSAADAPKLDKSVFGEIQARNIGPATMSGRITDIDAPASDPATVYVGTAGGGVWKSTNGGVSFDPVFDDYVQSIGCVTVDPNDPKTVWVGTGEINTRNSVSYGAGLYKTVDGGESWKLMGFADSERIAEVRVHPKDSKVVYVAVLGHLWNGHEERGLYKTEDGGENWERLLYVDENTGCIDVDLDPQEPDVVYAAMWQVRRWPWFFESGGPGSGLYKSTDGGKSFTKLTKDLPEGDLGRIDLDIAASRPNRLYAMVEAEKKKTGLYRSDDMGESWELVNTGFFVTARPFYLSIIKADPSDHNRVYNPSLSLSISDDGGKSFPGVFGFGGGVHSDIQAIWINPNDSNHVIIGTDGGVYISFDRAKSFRFVQSLPVSTFYRVTVDDAMPYNVYGGLQDNGSWMAPSAYPGGVGNKNWDNLGSGDGFCVAADKENPNYVYWESQGGILRRLDQTTSENKEITPYPEEGMEANRFNWNSPFAQSPTNPKTIYFGSQYLYKSSDKGDSWTRISPDLTTDDPEKQRQEESGGLTSDNTTAENHCTIFTIAESPLDEKVIWVGTDDGNVQVTRDGGGAWENTTAAIPDLPPHTWASSVWASAHDRGTAYATFTGHRHGDKKPYVYKTEDFGQSWKALATEDIKGHCHVTIQDPVNPDLLFLGTEMGLFVSFDDGGQWVHFRGNLPMTSVRDMTIQSREQDLVLATHGRGIYIIDDITPLRHLTADTLNQKLALLPARPARNAATRFVQQFVGNDYYVGSNPRGGINITYYLKRRHLFGDLDVEIYNEAGERVQRFSGGKRKGVNRVYWGMRLKPPQSPRSTGLSTGSFLGPLVPEGTYTVKVVKGDDVFEAKVELLPAHNNKHPEADRDLQFQTVMELYRTQENLNFVADQLLDLSDQIEELEKTVKKGSAAKKLAERREALEALRETVVSDGGSIFADRSRLRDEVVTLYGAVTGYLGRPGENQLARKKELEGRVAETVKKAEPLLDVAALNKALRGKGELKAMTREEWEKRYTEVTPSSTASAFMPTKAAVKQWHRAIAPNVALIPTLF